MQYSLVNLSQISSSLPGLTTDFQLDLNLGFAVESSKATPSVGGMLPGLPSSAEISHPAARARTRTASQQDLHSSTSSAKRR